MATETKKGLFSNPLLKTRIKDEKVRMPEAILGYLLGPFGALLGSGIFTAYLNKYWTNVLFRGEALTHIVNGVEVPTALSTFLTLLPLLSAILIVIGNLVVGQLIERTKTSEGKARPWILLSSIILGGSTIVMFTIPLIAGSNAIVKMVLTAISYNIYYSVAYPMYNTANSTMIPVSTRDSSSRSLLASFTNLSHLGVMGIGSMVFPTLVSLVIGYKELTWAIAFLVVGILTFVVTVLQYYFTRERVTEELQAVESKAEVVKLPISKQIGACVKEPFWWIILCFYLFFQFSGAIKNLSMTYFCDYVVDNSFWTTLGLEGSGGFTQTLLGVAGAIPMAAAMAFIWPLSRKFSKQVVVIGGALIGAAGGLLAGLMPTNPLAVVIGIALKCFGSAPGCYMILAMISDMLDHMEAKNGFRCDGFTMSIYSSLMVASTPVMTAVFNAILSAIGFNAEAFDLLVSTGIGVGSTAANALTISYVWIETIAYVAAALILCTFTVEKNLKADQEIIKARNEAAMADKKDAE